MTIAIRPDLERKIADKVRSGRYASADDVVADALDVLDRIEAGEPPRRPDISAAAEAGRAEADAGESLPPDVAAARLWDRIDRWRRERHETV
jgi:antitoxin ParD1/3/4